MTRLVDITTGITPQGIRSDENVTVATVRESRRGLVEVKSFYLHTTAQSTGATG
jgi:hypothetical protein